MLSLRNVEPPKRVALWTWRCTKTFKETLTLEQREAAYNEARSRIFMDFEEKVKEDMSASSSTFSLVSGSPLQRRWEQ